MVRETREIGGDPIENVHAENACAASLVGFGIDRRNASISRVVVVKEGDGSEALVLGVRISLVDVVVDGEGAEAWI